VIGSSAPTPSVSSTLFKRQYLFDDRVAKLTFTNPKQRNALSLQLMDELCRELRELDSIKSMRAVVLAGEGPAFSSGHDLKELLTTDQAKGDSTMQRQRDVFAKCTELMQQIQLMELPVIAEIDGVAAAAGCQLASQCDIAAATEKAQFMVPGLKVGLFCSTPAIPLARNIPKKLAMDMLLTSRGLNAHGFIVTVLWGPHVKVQISEALQAGLVSRVATAPNTAEAETRKVVEEILKMSRSVIALGKAFFYAQVEMGVNQALKYAQSHVLEG